MSYEQYTQIETQVLEMPYEQKIQLLSMIADNLKNTKVISYEKTEKLLNIKIR